ncbi:MAG: HAD-IC family P-type ATPase [Actinomycetaceae bacterium]|nr:HAD-IC family P-type ATPase [Actinomycetaceae bacterium]MDY6082273.1 HAD-IC family P-type ATPase [Actinomycetaceae bacterium]
MSTSPSPSRPEETEEPACSPESVCTPELDTPHTPDSLTDIGTGLSSDQVRERIEAGRVNTVPPASGRTVWQIVQANVFTRINAMLGILCALVITTRSWINSVFGVLIVLNSLVGIVQELRAKRTLDKLALIGQAHPTVIRDGKRSTVELDAIVEGDIILGRPGDQIIVDGVVRRADHFDVDESLLTGESDPVAKDVGDPVTAGSFISSGTGLYQATAVGAHSYAAQLGAQASAFSLVHSELQSGINKILGVISWILIPVAILTVLSQWHVGTRGWNAIMLSVTGALVPMVPEGLVLITSTAFALGVIRLARRKVLVNELPAIEGLARVDVVCADKTGTLTENAMTLGHIIPVGPLPEEEITHILWQLASADEAPNSSMLAIRDGVSGSASAPQWQESGVWQVAERQPFRSATKWSGVTFAEHGSFILGAPDVLLDASTASGTTNGSPSENGSPLADDAASLRARIEDLSHQGLRVLLLASSSASVTTQESPVDPQPLAVIILEQKVRPDAADTLRYFRTQDVDIKIISGDNASAVGAVTRSLGLDLGDPVDARTLTDENFASTVRSAHVFGRVTPAQKQRMVSALHEDGHYVAMTGDGVNDVLALKDADLGVAMGSGAPATRSVAKIVLLNNKFATLPHVVAEGRRVLGNIERVAHLFLTKTIYSSILAIFVMIASIPFPFQPIHVTITGWFTIGIPAFLLSLPPNNHRAKDGFVTRVLRRGVPSGVLIATSTFVTYMVARGSWPLPGLSFTGVTPTQASTASLVALIIPATWVLATVARPYRLWKVMLIVLPLAGYGIIFQWTLTQRLFILDSHNTGVMLLATAVGLCAAALIEVVWWIDRSRYSDEDRIPLWEGSRG